MTSLEWKTVKMRRRSIQFSFQFTVKHFPFLNGFDIYLPFVSSFLLSFALIRFSRVALTRCEWSAVGGWSPRSLARSSFFQLNEKPKAIGKSGSFFSDNFPIISIRMWILLKRSSRLLPIQHPFHSTSSPLHLHKIMEEKGKRQQILVHCVLFSIHCFFLGVGKFSHEL